MAASVRPSERQRFEERCVSLRERLCDADFLANKGLGNEAGIYLLCYDPALELQARAFVRVLQADCDAGRLGAEDVRAHLVVRNLYDTFLAIAQSRKILDRLPEQEHRRGPDGVLRQIQRIATPERYVQQMDWSPHQPGDVLLIDGVGEVYPFMRVHNVLNSLQAPMRDVPVVVMYPGAYDGGSMSLFGRLRDGNYYRAFDLV